MLRASCVKPTVSTVALSKTESRLIVITINCPPLHKAMSTVNEHLENTNQLANPKRGRHEVDADDEQQQTDQAEIKSLLLALSSKIDIMNTTMAGNDDRLNTKMDKLETALTTKIQEVKNDMEVRIQTVSTAFEQRLVDSELTTRQICAENIAKCENVLNMRDDELQAYHESRLDRLVRLALEKDLVISGVPLESNDDPYAIIGDICGALNCDLKSGDFVSIFRLKSGKSNANNKRSQPIVARIQDDWVKREVLTAYFRKKDLNLTDIGFKLRSHIYINERLTSTNRAIFNRAAEAKKSAIIHRFYSRRGLVYIQRGANSKPSIVQHISDLESLFPWQRSNANFDRGYRPAPDPSRSKQSSTPSTVNEQNGPSVLGSATTAPNPTSNDNTVQLMPNNFDNVVMSTVNPTQAAG